MTSASVQPSSLEVLSHKRFSPREYTPELVPQDILERIFDSARWSQSSFNEQPWRFLVAARDGSSERSAIEACLFEGNSFAKEAGLLGIAYYKTHFSHDGSFNRAAFFDTGAACQVVALQAFELGYNTRFMGGFHLEAARALAQEGYEPAAMFVIGKATRSAIAEKRERKRKPLHEILRLRAWSSTNGLEKAD